MQILPTFSVDFTDFFGEFHRPAVSLRELFLFFYPKPLKGKQKNRHLKINISPFMAWSNCFLFFYPKSLKGKQKNISLKINISPTNFSKVLNFGKVEKVENEKGCSFTKSLCCFPASFLRRQESPASFRGIVGVFGSAQTPRIHRTVSGGY